MAGIDNQLHVTPNKVVNSLINGLTIQATSTTGSSNNWVAVEGGTLNVGEITVGGYYDAGDPDNIIRADNQFHVHNEGQVNVNGNISVGAGSEARIESGGQVALFSVGSGTSRIVSLAEHGSFILDGVGSELKGSYTVGSDTFNGLIFNISGNAAVTDGATITGLTRLTVAGTGDLNFDGVTVDQNATTSGNNVTNIVGVSGLFEILNGSQFTVANQHVSGSGSGNFLVDATGRVLIDGGSHLEFSSSSHTGSENGGLNLLTGSSFELVENSTARVGRLLGVTTGITVEEGSEFRVRFMASSFSQQGKIIWEEGTGATGAVGNLSVNAGAIVALEGGVYSLGGSNNARSFTLNSGGLVEGSGTFGNSNPNDATLVVLNGGRIAPGTVDEAGTMVFLNGITTTAASTLELDLVAFDVFDQIQVGSFNTGGGTLTVKVNLADDLFQAGDEFPIVQNLSGNPFSFGGSANVAFDFSQSEPILTAQGLAWDTSAFLTTGVLKIGELSGGEPTPVLNTFQATQVTANGAQLNGSVNANGGSNTVSFEYGLDTSYGQTVEAVPSAVTGFSTVQVTAPLTGLLPGNTYHFRVVSNNGESTFTGEDRTFTTQTAQMAWRQQWFGTTDNAGNAADTATPARDGIANLLKFATTDGTVDPRIPGVEPGEVEPAIDEEEEELLTLTYNRSKAALAAGISFIVEWSDTLTPLSWSSVGVNEVEVIDEGETERVTVAVLRGEGDKRFLRLSVTGEGDPVRTTPAGATRLSIPGGGSSSVLGINLIAKPPFKGAATSVGTRTVTVNGVDLTSRLASGRSYALLVTSGANAGINTLVTSWTSNQLTVRDDLTGLLSSGQTFQIQQLPTIQEIFGVGGEVLAGGTATTADLVDINNPSTGEKLTLYYNSGGILGTGWRAIGKGNQNFANLGVYFTDGLAIKKKSAGSCELEFDGTVQNAQVRIPVGSGTGAFATIFAAGTTLANSGLFRSGETSASLTGGSSTTADIVSFDLDGDGTPENYFYSTGGILGTGWRRIGAGNTSQNDIAIPTGFVILKRQGFIELNRTASY